MIIEWHTHVYPPEEAAASEVARAAETRHLALPADIVANVPIPRYRAPITDAMLQSLIDIMTRQQMLSRKLDVSKLVVR